MNRKEEKDRENQLERVVNEEVEKQWAKRIAQYQMEKNARKKLMDTVMKTREQQIEDRGRGSFMSFGDYILRNHTYFLTFLVVLTIWDTNVKLGFSCLLVELFNFSFHLQ